MYTIQVAAIDNNDDLKKIQTSLVNNDIPFSVMEKDGVKKYRPIPLLMKMMLESR
ncbi:hypothetical protein ACK2FP_14155 [Clostridioides difficile]